MNRSKTLFSWGMLTVMCAGCASGIRVTQVMDPAKPVVGNPWNLPMTQFTVTITRHITSCGSSPTGSVEVIATPATAIDHNQQYVLEGGGWWGTSDITSNLAANGTSTGLNAQSTDATATVISNVVATLGQVALAAVALAPPLPGQPQPIAKPPCSPDVQASVDLLYPAKETKKQPLKAKVDDVTAALALATARVSLLTTESSIDPSLKKQLIEALDHQSALQSQLNDETRALTKALQSTTDTQVVTWPLLGTKYATDTPFLLDPMIAKRWTPGADEASTAVEFAVHMALFTPDLTKPGTWTVPVTPKLSDVKTGVPVRLGQTARLVICRKSACTPTQATPAAQDPNVTASNQTILQLGQVYTVPVTGGTFKAEQAVIALDANGLPTSIEVVEKVAGAAALTGATKDAATQIAALPGQVAAAQLAATQAKTNQLTANAALASAQANATVVGQTSGFTAQTTLINAQTALATAKANAGLPAQTAAVTNQAALLNAQASLVTAQANAGVADQTSALTAQTTLINAETAQINAAAALAKAQVVAHP